jgi:hypothetical protein
MNRKDVMFRVTDIKDIILVDFGTVMKQYTRILVLRTPTIQGHQIGMYLRLEMEIKHQIEEIIKQIASKQLIIVPIAEFDVLKDARKKLLRL